MPTAAGPRAPVRGTRSRALRTRWRNSSARAALGTVWVVVAASFSMSVAVTFASQEAESRRAGGEPALAAVWLLGLALAGALVVRRRYPVTVCLVAAGAALLFPLDSLTALIALTWVIATRSVRRAVACGAATALATAVALNRDRGRSPLNVVFSTVDQGTGDHVVLTPVGYVVVGLLCVGTAVGVGLVRRWKTAARDAIELQVQQVQVTDELRTEMTRQEEREVIAREVHDTVAHQLSLVSLHAAALEVSASADDGEVRDAAQSMRSAAHQALEELRDLIAVLRDPRPRAANVVPGVELTLADLPRLIDSARQAGAPVSSTIYISDAERAPQTLNRAVYRIVQESLTNALKHAPGQSVDIDVRGAPGAGVQLRLRNPLPDATPTVPPHVERGSGSGLVGMRERAALLGGSFDAGTIDGGFLVTADLPWPRERVVDPHEAAVPT